MSLKRKKLIAVIVIAVALVAAIVVVCRGCSKTVKPAREVEITRYAAGDFQSAVIAAAMTGATKEQTAALADERSLALYGVLANLGFSVKTNCADAADLVVTGGFPKRLPGKFGTLAILADVRGVSVKEFSKRIGTLAKKHDVRIWAPTAADWLITVSGRGVKPKLERLFELYCRENAFGDLAEAKANWASDIFASYVGGYDDVKAAFEVKDPSPQVRQEFLLTREILSFDWLDREGIDDEIFAKFAEGARTTQVVRRLICEGELKGDAGDADGAMDCWHRAFLRNPSDTLLGERLETLRRNSEVLASLGNSGGAAKCLETLIVINPKDVPSIERYAKLLRQLGKLELAQQVQKRADELKKSNGAGARGSDVAH